ncbi:MAG: hypothetical protein ABIY71_09895 [Flavobacteriales bacterium]
MMDKLQEQKQLASLHQRLRDYLRDHPEHVDVLFQYTDAEVRERAMERVKSLSLGEAAMLNDRIKYITRTRLVYSKQEAPRCRGKVIYTNNGAQAKVNRIWDAGRGHMRIYECPLCAGYHLTHTALRDSDEKAAMG